MLDDNVGFNISPTTWDNYPTIGRNGTFISDRQGITDIIGDFPGQPQLILDRSKTLQLEEAFGLDTGTLLDGFKIRRVENIVEQMPRSPLEGNQLFRGPGNHLPGGAPEMVIDSIPTVDSSNVSTLFEVLVK
ncbi:type IV secretion protein Rhs [Halomonas sp. SBBP1]|nr:type IV secretion protein Rhs [Halomonas sp. SBBP1]